MALDGLNEMNEKEVDVMNEIGAYFKLSKIS
jgi:hypothetical protein